MKKKNNMTNKTTLLKTLAATVLCMAAVACSDMENDLTGNESETSQSKGTVITAEAVLGENEQAMVSKAKQAGSPMTRVAVSPDGNGGLKYNWETGKTIPLYVYITDGTRRTTLTTTLKVESDRRGRFSFTVPADYKLASVKVAAATGKESDAENGAWATGIDATGKVTMGTPQSIDATSNKYNIPLYAKLTPVSADGKTASVTFSMLGSWIGVRAKSDMYYAASLYSVAVESDVLHMDGNLDLSTATPSWTPGKYRINEAGKEISDTIRVRGVVIGGSAAGKGTTLYSNMFYVWAKAGTSKNSTKKARVYVRDEATSLAGPVYKKADQFSSRNKFYREAKQVVQFADGHTYNFGINANLQESDGGLIITEYYHSTLATGEYNWIEITNATNKTISLDDYYLVSPDCDNMKNFYVMELKDLQRLDWKKRGVGYPANSTTTIPAGRSICLAAGQVNSGWDAVKKNGLAYQMVNTQSGVGNLSAVSGGIRLPKFLCKGGWNIDFNDPANNIVDNLGVRVVYDPAANKFLTYAYYLGNVTFLRTKETGMSMPQKNFLPEAWSFMNITWDYLGAYHDRNGNYKPLAGYDGNGQAKNFQQYDQTSSSFDKQHFRPDAKHPSPI